MTVEKRRDLQPLKVQKVIQTLEIRPISVSRKQNNCTNS